MAKKKRNKPRRKAGNPKHVNVPFTRAHSDRVKESKKEARRRARKERNEW